MKGFLLGFATASALYGAIFLWQSRKVPSDLAPLRAPDAGASITSDKRRRHRTAAPLLRPADLRPVSEGDNLSTPEIIDMDKVDPAGAGRELSDEEVDARFRARQADLLACIEQARPSADAAITGKVTIQFRIQRTGAVHGVRVEAPSVLMRGGLSSCIRPIVGGLRFPASAHSLVMTYPFQLD